MSDDARLEGYEDIVFGALRVKPSIVTQITDQMRETFSLRAEYLQLLASLGTP